MSISSQLIQTRIYNGTIYVGSEKIPVVLNIQKVLLLFDSKITVLNKNAAVLQGDPLNTQVSIIPMGDNVRTDVTLHYQIKNSTGYLFQNQSETMLVESLKSIKRSFDTNSLPPGNYIISLRLVYPNGVAPSSANFKNLWPKVIR